MSCDKLAFVDVETTGSRVNYDRIIEIGILRVENNKLVKTYQTFFNPEIYLSPFIEQITGIHQTDLENAPSFQEKHEEILDMLHDCVLVAHNARFDFGFLKNEFGRLNIPFSMKHLCSVKLSRLLFPEHTHHNLDSIMERFNIACENRHRAFDDAQVIWEFFKKIDLTLPKEYVQEAIDKLLKKPSVPSQLPAEYVENLPRNPGVYIFYDKGDLPLYIGKSINIRDRVLSHFNSDHESTKEMNICQQIQRIETITTAGELGALMKESDMIKKMMPIYNRKLRNSRSLVIARQKKNEYGVSTVFLEELGDIDGFMLDSIIGIFKSKKQAKDQLTYYAKEHLLCEKMLGLEHTKGACFGHKLGICQGICVGKENVLNYNLRFLEAFSKLQIQRWPFDGPIMIEERSVDNEKYAGFIIYNWCLIGEITINGQEKETSFKDERLKFDYDMYKVLIRYLSDGKNHKFIKRLPSSFIERYLNGRSTESITV